MTPRTRCIIKSCIHDLAAMEGTQDIVEKLSDLLDPDPEPITAEQHQENFKCDSTKNY